MRKVISLAAATCLVGSALAAPAEARDWHGHYHYHHHGDRDFGDFVAGAVLVAGVAALISAIHGNDRARQDAAVDRCAHEAEGRTGGQVGDITHVASSKGYYTVEGTLDAGLELPSVRDGRFDGPIHNGSYDGPPADGAGPPPPPQSGVERQLPPPGPLSFRCVVHNGTIYSFRTAPAEA